MDEGGEIDVDPAATGVASISTSPDESDATTSMTANGVPVGRFSSQESHSELLLSLDELDLGSNVNRLQDSTRVSPSTALETSLIPLPPSQQLTPQQQPDETETEAAKTASILRREKQTLQNLVESLQKSVKVLQTELSLNNEQRIEEAKLWEKDFEEFEENRNRAKLLELDLADLERKVAEKEATELALVNTVRALEGELGLYVGTGQLRPDLVSSVDGTAFMPPLPGPDISYEVITGLNARIHDLETQLAVTTSDAMLAETHSREMTEIVEIANTENARISATMTLLEARVSEMSVEIDALRSNLSTANSKNDDLLLEKTRLQKQLSSKTQQSLAQQTIQTSTQQSDREHSLQQQLESIQYRNLQLENDVAMATTDKILAETTVNELTTALDLCQSQLSTQSTTLTSTESKLSALQIEKEALQESVKLLSSEKTKLAASKASRDASIKELKNTKLQLEDRIREMSGALDKSVQEHSMVFRMYTEKDGALKSLSTEVDALKIRVRELESSLEVVTMARDAVLSELDLLRFNQLASKNSFYSHQQEHESLKSRLVLLQQALDCATADRDTALNDRNQLLAEKTEWLRNGHSQDQQSSYHLTSLETENSRLRFEITSLQELYNLEKINFSESMAKWKADLESLTSDKMGLEASLGFVTTDANKMREMLGRQEKDIIRMETDIAALKGELQLRDLKIHGLEGEAAQLVASARENSESMASNHHDVFESLKAQVQERDTRIASVEQQMLHLSNHNTDLESQLITLKSEIVELQDNCIEFSDLNQSLEDEVETLRASIKLMKTEKQTLKSNLNDSVQKSAALESDVQQLEYVVRDCLSYLVPQNSELMIRLGKDLSVRNAKDAFFVGIKAALDLVRHHENLIQQILERNVWPGSRKPMAVSFETVQACLEHLEVQLEIENQYTISQDLHLARQQITQLKAQLDQLSLHTTTQQSERDAQQLSLLQFELETHHRNHQDHLHLLARVKEIEIYNSTRLRELEAREVGYLRDLEETDAETARLVRVFEGKEREFIECVERLEESLVNTSRELNLREGGRVLDGVFQEALESLEYRMRIGDGMLRERDDKLRVLEGERESLRGVEEKVS
ncbi:UNVERIFIED_CONTAM: hypothetical protein HDU68_011273 [Siphonaria sp. JEL0065]|nr:hypothetical protein HDU68_011273 [Siphonaria sp. JEL0065]